MKVIFYVVVAMMIAALAILAYMDRSGNRTKFIVMAALVALAASVGSCTVGMNEVLSVSN